MALLAGIPCPAVGQSLNKTSDISFGMTEFSGSPASGNLTLGTNGSVGYSGNLSGTGMGTAAQVEMTGTVGNSVDIRCSATGTLSDGTNTLALDPVKVSVQAAQSYAAATACAGSGVNVLSHTLSATSSNNIVYLGGQLQTSGQSLTGSSYTTGNSGGAGITLTVIFN